MRSSSMLMLASHGGRLLTVLSALLPLHSVKFQKAQEEVLGRG